jgi:hypothetical protein
MQCDIPNSGNRIRLSESIDADSNKLRALEFCENVCGDFRQNSVGIIGIQMARQNDFDRGYHTLG